MGVVVVGKGFPTTREGKIGGGIVQLVDSPRFQTPVWKRKKAKNSVLLLNPNVLETEFLALARY
jgi:hypothetical protein